MSAGFEALIIAGVSFVISWLLANWLDEPPATKAGVFIFLFPSISLALYVFVRGFLYAEALLRS